MRWAVAIIAIQIFQIAFFVYAATRPAGQPTPAIVLITAISILVDLLSFVRLVHRGEWSTRTLIVLNLSRALIGTLAVTAMWAALYRQLSLHNPEAFTAPLSSVTAACYFAVTTLTTVGYGDIAPVADGARWAVIFQQLTDIMLLTAGLGVLTARVADRRRPTA